MIQTVDKAESGIIANSVLVRLGFKVLGNSKKADVTVETTADQKRFKVHKTLLDSEELKAVSKADMKIRQYLYAEAVPFDMGSHLIAFAKLDSVLKVLDNYRDVERPALVKVLVDAYPGLVDAAKQALGPEFDVNQFLPAEQVANQFVFEYKLLGFDVPGTLANVNKSLYDAEVAKVAEKVANVSHEIQQAQRAVLFSLVDNLAFKLQPDGEGKQRRLNPTAVTKLQEFLTDFKLQDVTGDKEASKLIEQLQSLTSGVSPDSFKNNDALKSSTASSLISITESLAGMLDVVPDRKFKDVD